MNGFERHGLAHTSPSQINMWAESPDAWVAKYLFNKSFSFGVAPLIGTLVESVVADVVCGRSLDESVAEAEKQFAKKTALGASEKERERIADIRAMAEIALAELAPYGEPEFVNKLTGREQQKIELICNGADWSLPVIGFLDFVYPKHGLIIDLKTTMRIPSEISIAHQRQGAIYAKAKKMSAKFLYCSPKKSVVHDITDIDEALADVKKILKRQESFLRLHDAETIKEIIPVNVGSYYWTADAHIRRELYNI